MKAKQTLSPIATGYKNRLCRCCGCWYRKPNEKWEAKQKYSL